MIPRCGLRERHRRPHQARHRRRRRRLHRLDRFPGATPRGELRVAALGAEVVEALVVGVEDDLLLVGVEEGLESREGEGGGGRRRCRWWCCRWRWCRWWWCCRRRRRRRRRSLLFFFLPTFPSPSPPPTAPRHPRRVPANQVQQQRLRDVVRVVARRQLVGPAERGPSVQGLPPKDAAQGAARFRS